MFTEILATVAAAARLLRAHAGAFLAVSLVQVLVSALFNNVAFVAILAPGMASFTQFIWAWLGLLALCIILTNMMTIGYLRAALLGEGAGLLRFDFARQARYLGVQLRLLLLVGWPGLFGFLIVPLALTLPPAVAGWVVMLAALIYVPGFFLSLWLGLRLIIWPASVALDADLSLAQAFALTRGRMWLIFGAVAVSAAGFLALMILLLPVLYAMETASLPLAGPGLYFLIGWLGLGFGLSLVPELWRRLLPSALARVEA